MSSKKQILFVHQNFPGQYRYLARYYARHEEWNAIAVGERKCMQRQINSMPQGVTLLAYDMPENDLCNVSARVKYFADYVDRSDALEKVLLRQKVKGLSPDIILAHPGWGEALYLKEIFPNAKLICFFEYFFSSTKNNINFDPYLSSSLDQKIGYRMSNTASLIAMDSADVGVCPTHWQLSTFPEIYHQEIRVIHDGVDTQVVCPRSEQQLVLHTIKGQKVTVSKQHEIISYSVRNLEPSRGFHRFAAALPELQRQRPDAYIIVVGGDEVSYSKAHPSGKCWREVIMEEVSDECNMERIIFTGKIPYISLLTLFSITRLHIYLTTPFVLSWSLLEAMACEAPILASATPPVEEVIIDGENGKLFDYFSTEDLINKAVALLNNKKERCDLGVQARRHIVKHYDLHSVCLPQHIAMIEA